MINSNLLRGKMAIAGMTQKDLAVALGISENTISSKINGKSRLYVDEVSRICDVLQINENAERAEIFYKYNPKKG